MLNDTSIEEFRAGLRGQLVSPGDGGYEAARKVWNGLIDRHPAIIVRCADESDVVSAVNYARANHLLVAVRGGGHNVAGFATCDGGIVIDISALKGIEVDVAARTVTWGEFDEATQADGLATTGGLVTTTGIAGFTLGGGFGWLVRKHGLTVDNLLSVEMVLANGECVTASSTENADLFWGVRGGGGNFGIVTSFKYRLHPVGPSVYSGAIFHPAAKAKQLLRFYREWAPAPPDELSTMVGFLTAPPEPFVPKDLVGTPMVAIALCYDGEMPEGEQVVKPLRDFVPPAIDLVGPVPYTALQGIFDAGVPKGIHAYWKSEYLRVLSDDALDALIEHVSRMRSLSPYSAVHIHHWEGAVKRTDPDATAFAHRDAPYVLNILGLWTARDDADKHTGWAREFSRAIQSFATGQVYLNFLGDEGEDRIRRAYGAEKYARPVALKKRYDPDNVFRLNQNIKPA